MWPSTIPHYSKRLGHFFWAPWSSVQDWHNFTMLYIYTKIHNQHYSRGLASVRMASSFTFAAWKKQIWLPSPKPASEVCGCHFDPSGKFDAFSPGCCCICFIWSRWQQQHYYIIIQYVNIYIYIWKNGAKKILVQKRFWGKYGLIWISNLWYYWHLWFCNGSICITQAIVTLVILRK